MRVEAGKDPSADLGLIDREGRAGVVLSERRSGPYVSLSVAALRLTRAQLRSPPQSAEVGSILMKELYLVLGLGALIALVVLAA